MNKLKLTIRVVGITLLLGIALFFIADEMDKDSVVVENATTQEEVLGSQNRNRNRKMNKRELLDALNSGQREFKNVELNNLK